MITALHLLVHSSCPISRSSFPTESEGIVSYRKRCSGLVHLWLGSRDYGYVTVPGVEWAKGLSSSLVCGSWGYTVAKPGDEWAKRIPA